MTLNLPESLNSEVIINHKHNFDLAMNIINGIRPKIIPETPLEYKILMEQCWDADPSKRPDIDTLVDKIEKMYSHYQNMSDELIQQVVNNTSFEANYTSSRLFTSKIHHFKNMPEPKNATEGII